MVDEPAPTAVAVVVAAEPGPWFEECLASLKAQDYPGLSVLVVDAGGADDLAGRVAPVLPEAYLASAAKGAGFAAAANLALQTVEGASYLVFCHDDVVLAPDVVRRLLEASFRSNAAVVGSKLVDYYEPRRLRQLGLDVDRFGLPSPRVEPGELDQGQHDEAREVVAVPGGCTLIRADLFHALGGFDADMLQFGEDVDLCWRARLLGARVAVAPMARVRHLEASASGRRAIVSPQGLQRRHGLRTVLKTYRGPRRFLVLTQLMVWSLAELVYCTAARDRARAASIRAAWRWNWSHRASTRAARHELQALRTVSDRDVARALRPGAARLQRAARQRADGRSRQRSAPELARWSAATRVEPRDAARGLPLADAASGSRPRWTRTELALVGSAIVVLVIAGRDLLGGPLPLLGQLAPIPGPLHLLARYFEGTSDGGLHRLGAAPPGLFLVGLAGLVLGGAMGTLEKLWLLLPLVAGPIGCYRLLKPRVSRRGALIGGLVYAFLPLSWNAVARGGLEPLVAFGIMPFIAARLAHAVAGSASRARPARPRFDLRSLGAEALVLGMLCAVGVALAPGVALLLAIVAVGFGLGSVGAGWQRLLDGLRGLVVAAGAAVVAFALLLPWSFGFFSSGARWSLFTGSLSAAPAVSLATVARLALGPLGGGALGWGFVVAASFVLLVGRSDRLAWGVRWWAVGLGSIALAWVGGRGWLGTGFGATQLLVVPAALGIAVSIGLGISAFEHDVRRSVFGWRQVAAFVAALAVVAGVLPMLGTAFSSGRFDLPTDGYEGVLSWTGTLGTASRYKLLWLGSPATLPGSPWQVQSGLAAEVSLNGLPTIDQLWPSPTLGETSRIDREVELATRGGTVTLGALLRPDAVRYLVVPTAIAPVLPGVQDPSAALPPPSLIAALRQQVDLRELPSEGSILVFLNTSLAGANLALSASSTAPRRGARSSGGLSFPLEAAAEVAAWLALLAALGLAVRRRRVHLPGSTEGAAAAEAPIGRSAGSPAVGGPRRLASLSGVALGLGVVIGFATALPSAAAGPGAGGALVALPSVPPVAAATNSWFCPGPLSVGRGKTEGAVLLVNTADRAVGGELIVRRADGLSSARSVSLAAGSEDVVPMSVVGAPSEAAVQVLLSAGGVGVEELGGSASSTVTSPCTTVASSTSYLPLGATAGRSSDTVSIFNPGATPAVANLSLVTENGAVAPPAYQGIAVAPGSLVVEHLGLEVPNEPVVATTMTTMSGQLVLGELAEGPIEGSSGTLLAVGESEPLHRWATVLPPMSSGEEMVRVFNPGARRSVVTVRGFEGPGAVSGATTTSGLASSSAASSTAASSTTDAVTSVVAPGGVVSLEVPLPAASATSPVGIELRALGGGVVVSALDATGQPSTGPTTAATERVEVVGGVEAPEAAQLLPIGAPAVPTGQAVDGHGARRSSTAEVTWVLIANPSQHHTLRLVLGAIATTPGRGVSPGASAGGRTGEAAYVRRDLLGVPPGATLRISLATLAAGRSPAVAIVAEADGPLLLSGEVTLAGRVVSLSTGLPLS